MAGPGRAAQDGTRSFTDLTKDIMYGLILLFDDR